MSVRSSAELIALCRALLAEDGLVIGIGLAIAAIKTWWQAYKVSQSLKALESAVEVSIEDFVSGREKNKLGKSNTDHSVAGEEVFTEPRQQTSWQWRREEEAASNNSSSNTTVTVKRAALENRASAVTEVGDEAMGLVVVRGSVQPAYDWTLTINAANPSRSPSASPPATSSPSSPVAPSSPLPSSSSTVVPRASAISSWPLWSSHGLARPCVVVEKADVVRSENERRRE